MVFQKVDFRGTIAPLGVHNQWTKVHRAFFVERRRERCLPPGFQILDISILSGDIRAQSGKVS